MILIFSLPSQYEGNTISVFVGTVNDTTAIFTGYTCQNVPFDQRTLDSEDFTNCFNAPTPNPFILLEMHGKKGHVGSLQRLN